MSDKIHFLDRFGRQGKLRQAICGQQTRLYRIAWSWCHDSERARDLTQETLTRALEKLDSLQEEDRLEVWLTRILANLFRDQLKRMEPLTGYEVEQIRDPATQEQIFERNQLIDRTHDAVRSLSDNHRQVVTLVDIAEFSYVETAQILNLPVGTVMSRLARARGALKTELERQQGRKSVVLPLRRRP